MPRLAQLSLLLLTLWISLAAFSLDHLPRSSDEPVASEPMPRWVACFAPDTSPDVIASWYAQPGFAPGVTPDAAAGAEYFLGGSWGPAGEPIELTWSLVPDDTLIGGQLPGSGNSSLFAELDAQFNGDTPKWIGRIESTFARWDELTGLSLTRVNLPGSESDDGAPFGAVGEPNRRGDIRIGMRALDGPGGVLAVASLPSGGGFAEGDILLDSADPWHSTLTDLALRNVLFHELGHAFGVLHSCPVKKLKLMEPVLILDWIGPQHDDLRALHSLYGDANEDNDSPASATQLATPAIFVPEFPCAITGEPKTVPALGSRCAFDSVGDDDYYRLPLGAGDRLDVILRPLGHTYDDAPQDPFTGDCPAGSPTDSLHRTDLALWVFDASGQQLLASSDAGGSGEPEVLLELDVSGHDELLLLVAQSGVYNGVQTYELELRQHDSSHDPGTITSFGTGVAGLVGVPQLTGEGDLTPGSPLGFTAGVSKARPFASGLLFLGTQQGALAFKGGTLYAFPATALLPVTASGPGTLKFEYAIPEGTPAGLDVVAQIWFLDAAAVQGASATNGLLLELP